MSLAEKIWDEAYTYARNVHGEGPSTALLRALNDPRAKDADQAVREEIRRLCAAKKRSLNAGKKRPLFRQNRFGGQYASHR